MHPKGCIFFALTKSGSRRLSQPLQKFERVKAGGMPVGPYWLNGIATHSGNPLESEGGRRESDFPPFMELSQDIHLPFAACTRAGTTQTF